MESVDILISLTSILDMVRKMKISANQEAQKRIPSSIIELPNDLTPTVKAKTSKFEFWNEDCITPMDCEDI